GVILTIAGILFFPTLVFTLLNRRPAGELGDPLAEPLHEAAPLPQNPHRFMPWVVTGPLLALIGYGPTIFRLLTTMQTVAAPALNPYCPDARLVRSTGRPALGILRSRGRPLLPRRTPRRLGFRCRRLGNERHQEGGHQGQ